MPLSLLFCHTAGRALCHLPRCLEMRAKKGRQLLGEEGGEPHRNGVCRPEQHCSLSAHEKQMVVTPTLVRASLMGHNPAPMMMAATQIVALIVEDDASTREFIVKVLEKVGIDTLQAASVGEALVMMEQEPLPTAVILDLMLPDASGTILLRRIKRDALPVRVAVVTGVKDPYAFWDVLRFPPDRLFKKPLDISELVAWLQQEP